MTLKEIRKSLTITNGNKKTGKGVANVSTLPGDKNHLITLKDGTVLSDVFGTCGGFCHECIEKCYADRIAKRYENIRKAWEKNTLLLRNDPEKFFSLIDEYLNIRKKVCEFRWNVSGEIETYDQLERMDDLARRHPGVWFGVYTKRYTYVLKFLRKHGSFAPNFIVNISVWHNLYSMLTMFYDYHKEINFFAYDDGTASKAEQKALAMLPHCRAVGNEHKETGVQCIHCNVCYRCKGQITAVYSH